MDTAVPLTRGERTIPSWIPGRSVAFFFIALFACWLAWGYVPAMDLVIVSVIFFRRFGDVKIMVECPREAVLKECVCSGIAYQAYMAAILLVLL